MESLGRIMAVFIAIILILLLPLKYIAQGQGEYVEDVVHNHVVEFTDQARQQGYITLDSYENLIDTIDHTGELYDLSLEVSHPVSGEEVAKVSVGDQMPDLTMKNVSSTEEGYLTNYNPGTRYYVADYSKSDGKSGCPLYQIKLAGGISGFYFVPPEFTIRFRDRSSTTYVYFRYELEVLSDNTVRFKRVDHAMYYIDGWYGYCPDDVPEYLSFSQFTSLTEYIHLESFYEKYLSSVEDTLYEQNHHYIYPRYISVVSRGGQYLAKDDQVVTSITATDPVQTVRQGEDMITTATATYLDGHTDTVECSSNFNKDQLGEQTVTLTYSGFVGEDKKIGTRTCNVSVTVKPQKSLTAVSATPMTQEVTRYDDPSFTVTALYDDNSSEIVSDYSISDFNNTVIGTQEVTITYSENGITCDTTIEIKVHPLTIECPVCGTEYYIDENDEDHGCPACASTLVRLEVSPEVVTVTQGEELSLVVRAIYRNGEESVVANWSSNYDPEQIGMQEVTITYDTVSTFLVVYVVKGVVTCPICGTDYNLNEDGSDPGCPICSTEVESIEVSPKKITIEMYETMDITVTATYKDGHTEEVHGWTTDFLADTVGTFQATISYQNLSDQIEVTVTEGKTITCLYCGLEYYFAESPKGCPICSKTIVGIEASLRDGGNQVLCHSTPNIQISLIYQDTHRELTYDGWAIEGYDAEVLGEQAITVSYGEFSSDLTIQVVNNPYQVRCPACGTVYYLNADGSDPGCPNCGNDSESETKAIYYFDITYTNDIIAALYQDGIYYLESGDYFTIHIKPKGTSMHDKLQNLFWKSKEDAHITYGGEVL